LVRRSPDVRFVEVSQVVGNTVRMAPAIEHPGLDGAVAFVGATSIVPLLAGVDHELSIRDLLDQWRSAVAAPTDAAQIVAWMLRTGALEAVG
jgi:hypothetical protein